MPARPRQTTASVVPSGATRVTRRARNAPALAPGAVGAEVRRLVEARLARTDAVAAEALFLDRIERFAEALALWGTRFNLTAEPASPEAVALHVIDSLAPLLLARRSNAGVLADALERARTVLDLGSGAGMPGLILAAALDRLSFTLVEARRKRASFLSVAATAMRLANVRVESVRLPSRTFAERFDLVTARAFGRVENVYRIAAEAASLGGLLLLYASQAQPIALLVARAHGFESAAELTYEIDCDGHQLRRLVVWKKVVEPRISA